MTFISYAQNYEDVILWRALKHLTPGFYIDIGAAWPDEHSVTKAFYERGWRGINIEPNPEFFAHLVSERPQDTNLELAVSNQDGEAEINLIKDTGLSTLSKDIAEHHVDEGWSCTQIIVQAKTLSSVWRTYVPQGQEVHFLKLDVEGFEKTVIESNDWLENRPWVVIVESTLPSSQIENYQTWQSYLLKANYTFVYADGLNRFYLANEHSSLASYFAYPPNIFDGFKLVDQHKAEVQLHEIQALNHQLEGKITAIQQNSFSLKKDNDRLREEIDQLKIALHILNNSRSMRLTAPLRSAGNFTRKIKLSFRAYAVGNHKLKFISGQIIGSLRNTDLVIAVKKKVSKVFVSFVLLLKRNQSINKIAKYLLCRMPGLDSRIRRTYSSVIYSLSFQDKKTKATEVSDLSSTARQVHTQLRQAIDKYHRDKY
ncbi:FkbM family methyltransferase [Nodosilinea sp. LEGE 06152]|uniref:FkbM family methyltransferase n=1 Tax=Nodosilinea sp. LEGE 06152 TaxID=2777966 RepID=UPI00187EFC7F|nr:FkbM family methyltransferase [Nodosilinea sp. LEGE 06152]MBE9157724.1 FkbM family methyltransferase [Nodosilinea sp. LEGE 06152]